MPAVLHREKYPPAFRSLTLARRREIAPDFFRLRLASPTPDALRGFRAPGAGDHGRVFVGRREDSWHVAVDELGVAHGEFRVETIVASSPEQGWVDIDVLVHRGADGSPAGLIGPWAAEAPLGAPAVLADPKGSVLMTGRPRHWVLAGDDSAVPAIRRYLRMLGADSSGHTGGSGTLLLETHHDPAALELEVSGSVEVSILTPQAGRPSAALIEAFASIAGPPEGTGEGEYFVFACAEQSIVAPVRARLEQWGIDGEQAVVKGYWRRDTR